MRKLVIALLLLSLPMIIVSSAVAQTNWTDADMRAAMTAGGGTVTWAAGTEHILRGRVFIENGETLIVEEGVTIRGGNPLDNLDDGYAEEVSALIITRGGYAEIIGTATDPIIMTHLDDDLAITDDIPFPTRGLWGGLVVLGHAHCRTDASAVTWWRVEGIPTDIEPERTKYGYGDDPMWTRDDDDNSGIYQYISIRHGGHEIGEANEINGLTMGAVGRGTTIDHVEVTQNDDDGFEWFGGTVDCKYLVSSFNKDDSFDYDEAWTGRGQFWFSITAEDLGDHGGEHDGNQEAEGTAGDFSEPYIANVTYIGSGKDNQAQTDQKHVFAIRDVAGGHYHNGIFIDFPYAGFNPEDETTGDPAVNTIGCPDGSSVPATDPEDTEKRAREGSLTFDGTWWWDIGATTLTPDVQPFSTWPGDAHIICDKSATSVPACFSDETANGTTNWAAEYLFGDISHFYLPANPEKAWEANRIGDPQLTSIDRNIHSLLLDPRLQSGSPALTAAVPVLPTDPWFDVVNYVGAFDENSKAALWTDGWTYIWDAQFTPRDYLCGDGDGNGLVNISDAVFLIAYIFGGGPAPVPLLAADSDCNQIINISDAVYLISYIFGGGPAPCANCS